MTETNVDARIAELAAQEKRHVADADRLMNQIIAAVADCSTRSGIDEADFDRLRGWLSCLEHCRRDLREIDHSRKELRRG